MEIPGQSPNIAPAELDAVRAALENPEWDFRTPQGIENDTGISAERVSEILEASPDIARKSVYQMPDGSAVYAPADRPKTLRERAAELRWILAR